MARSLACMMGATAVLALCVSAAYAADAGSLSKRSPLRILVYPEKDRGEFFAVDGKEAGFEREILEGFARAQKLHIEVVTVPRWEALVTDLVEGKGDIVAGHFTDTEERRTHVDFTRGLLPTRTVIITRKPHLAVLTARQLQTEKVGAVKGSAAFEDLAAAGVPRNKIEEVTFENMLEALRSGRVTALARSVPLAVLSQRDDPAIEIGMFVGGGSSFAFGVRKGDSELRDALNTHIDLLNSTGQWNRLVVKYFGPAAVDILKRAQQ